MHCLLNFCNPQPRAQGSPYALSIGRFDTIMYKYYKQYIKAKVTARELQSSFLGVSPIAPLNKTLEPRRFSSPFILFSQCKQPSKTFKWVKLIGCFTTDITNFLGKSGKKSPPVGFLLYGHSSFGWAAGTRDERHDKFAI